MAVPQYPFPVVGGLEKQAHELAIALSHRGHSVSVLSGRITPEQPDVSFVDGVEVHRIIWPSSRHIRWFIMPLLLWARVRKLIAKVDVIHAHVFSGFGLYMILLGRIYRKPVLVKLPNVGQGGLPGLARGLLGPLRLRIFSLADAVVAMSPTSLAELRAIGYDVRRVLATPNGIRITQVTGKPAQSPASVCRFVFAGRLHEQKGLFDLLAAVQKLVGEFGVGDFSVNLYGDGPQRAQIGRYIETAGMGDTVKINGHVEGLHDVLGESDVFVLPSYREGNSNAILEAMVAGLPVISTRVGGTPMLVGAAGADLLYEPGDVDELARLMHLLIVDPGLRAARGAAMKQRVLDCFDIRHVADTYAAAYRLLAAGRREDVHGVSNPVVLEGA